MSIGLSFEHPPAATSIGIRCYSVSLSPTAPQKVVTVTLRRSLPTRTHRAWLGLGCEVHAQDLSLRSRVLAAFRLGFFLTFISP